jgi:HK97 family phage portal protein
MSKRKGPARSSKTGRFVARSTRRKTGTRRKSQLTNRDDWFYEWLLGGARSASGVVVSPSKALEEVVTMACVSIRAQDLAKLPVHVFRYGKDGTKTVIANHPLEKLFKRPNSWQTWLEFVETVGFNYLLRGAGYAPLLRDSRGRATDFIPVEQVTPWIGGGEIFYQVTPANELVRQLLNGMPDRISAADMFQVRGPSMDGVSEISRVHKARNDLGLSLSLTDHASRMFANGGRPGGVLETDKKLDEVAFNRVKSQFDKNYGGDNTGKTALLEQGLKWKPQQFTAVETQTVEAIEAQAKKSAIIWDVPLHRLGLMEDGGDIVAANAMYLNHTLSSDAERWERRLNYHFDLDGETEGVEFDLDYFNRATLKDQLEAIRIGIVGSVISTNEGRRKLAPSWPGGLPDDPKGNTIMQPANTVPLGTPPSEPKPGPGSDTTGEPAAGGDGDPAAVPPPDDKKE